jgi:microprocessor complex subunit DGCR8
MNPNGKSYVCILHEYVQHALKKQPTYEFKELENSATPYSATVSINNLKYGVGYGGSKKQAKSEAARETLEVLIPEMREKITGLDKGNQSTSTAGKPATASSTAAGQDLSVFDEIRIEDPRVPEFCQKTTEPSPHSILLTCLQRNYGLGSIQVKYEVNTAKHKKNEYTMTVGQHVAKVYCKNKRDGKQRASQSILQNLHPHINTWGSLLRLYGNRSVKSFKEKKQEEQEITVLQTRAAVNQPNYAILDKLKTEMLKLKDMKNNVYIGQLSIPPPVLSVAPKAAKTISISKI